VFEGDGRGSGSRGDEPMVIGRWQWQFLAEPLPYSQSDHKIRTVPAATLAFGASTVRGPYTRFSSSGGGQLEGFEQGGDERYTLTQWLQELAWQYSGFSFQQEFHVKEIKDHEASRRSTLTGGYAQFGKAWPLRGKGHPRAWELAVRVGRVDWEDTFPDRTQDELTLASNLFLSGHENKLTAEISRISLDEDPGGDEHEARFRLQWDVSF
jgi:phosphate-selective porin OprO and OprP